VKHWKLAGALVLAVVDAYLLTHEWSAVAGNLYAQVIISTPQVLGMYELLKRRADRHQAAVHARLDAQDRAQKAHAAELAAHRADLAAVAGQVGEIHSLHVAGVVPKRLIQP
jgi:hypothetical protein